MLTEHTANSLQLATHGPVERVVREAGHDLVIDPAKALCESLVMMVDDEETTIEVLEAVLEDFGYRNFVTTTRSSEAIDLLMREPVDVVLLDINMPEVTGFDILRDMRSRPELEHVPVIILTASNDSKTKLEALHLGATDFLAKPVDPSELALRLRNTLAAKSYLDRLTYFDPLTGLPNRKWFTERLDTILSWARHERKTSVVLLVNLDRFKEINDTLGQ